MFYIAHSLLFFSSLPKFSGTSGTVVYNVVIAMDWGVPVVCQ